MQRLVPDWLVQLVWFLAGVYATGSLWYFLSRDDYISAGLSFGGAAVLAFVAVQLQRLNDRSSRHRKIREALAAFVKQAEVLHSRSTEDPLPYQDHNAWLAAVETYLGETLDASYLVRLSNFSGMTFGSDGSHKSTYQNNLKGRMRRLLEFTSEFKT